MSPSLQGMQLHLPTKRSGVSYITPTDIADLILWYDGLDASTMFSDTAGTTPATVGGAVARWNDKSASARHATQATPANQPTRYSAGGVSFDGLNDGLTFTSLPTVATPTIFVVYDVVAFTLANYLLKGSTGIYAGGTFAGINGYAIVRSSIFRASNTEPTSRGVVMFKPAMLRRNGVEPTYEATPGTPTGSALFDELGGAFTTRHNGRIYEVAVYNRDLTLAEIQAFEAYAINRWGIVVS